MTNQEITDGLQQLGFNSGWVVTGDVITLWTNSAPKPTTTAIKDAALLWASGKVTAETARLALVEEGDVKLRAAGLSQAMIDARRVRK